MRTTFWRAEASKSMANSSLGAEAWGAEKEDVHPRSANKSSQSYTEVYWIDLDED